VGGGGVGGGGGGGGEGKGGGGGGLHATLNEKMAEGNRRGTIRSAKKFEAVREENVSQATRSHAGPFI
jgi:hypothetical protein